MKPPLIFPEPNKYFLLTLFAWDLIALMTWEFLKINYSRIKLVTNNSPSILMVFFAATILFFCAFTLPYIAKYCNQLKIKSQKLTHKHSFLVISTCFLLLLATYSPLMMLVDFPYDKKQGETVYVLTKDTRKIKQGGSASYFSLITTSWRNLPAEEFKSEFYPFTRYSKGDALSIRISKDIFGKIRVASIKKSRK
ncbi:hypothetical protein [Acaryochloris sp. IP29b_bin.148]|uniref:hypothetical protein n=1 Tax=Acaryochloris sp. IP29b_bin.148 TaxID=2969218 RepID=UPI002608AB65|nr:hypothetical protein [Acaryochloris sp. IP29b_bin.148]